MPKISIRMYEGRTDEQKNEIVEVITRELSRILDRGPEHFEIKFDEIPLDKNAPSNLK